MESVKGLLTERKLHRSGINQGLEVIRWRIGWKSQDSLLWRSSYMYWTSIASPESRSFPNIRSGLSRRAFSDEECRIAKATRHLMVTVICKKNSFRARSQDQR